MYKEKKKSCCSNDFAIVPNSLVKNKDLTSTAKLVFAAIAGHARRKDGQAHILASTIAGELGVVLNDSSLTKRVNELATLRILDG